MSPHYCRHIYKIQTYIAKNVSIIKIYDIRTQISTSGKLYLETFIEFFFQIIDLMFVL